MTEKEEDVRADVGIQASSCNGTSEQSIRRGLAFWKSEIIRTKEYLEEFFHIVITEEMIRDAVHLNNEIRMSLKNLCELMKMDPAPVKGGRYPEDGAGE